MPSGGDVRRDLYSEKRRFDATLEAMFLLRVVQPGVESELGGCGREMIVEEGIATDTLVCITYFRVLQYYNGVHPMIGVGVEPGTEGGLLDWGYLFLHPTIVTLWTAKDKTT
jgi:hypothetical protein